MDYKPFDVPLKEYVGLIKRREYCDDMASNWWWSTMDQKIIRLAGFVQQGGNLKKLLNNYAEGRDEMYRERIQYCVANYILWITDCEKSSIGTDKPFVYRIKRLDKDELVKLLSYLLKTCVREESYIDKNHEIQTRWVVEYKNKLTPDEVLDKIDKRHWRTHPEESYYTWWHRSEYWWDHHHFLW